MNKIKLLTYLPAYLISINAAFALPQTTKSVLYIIESTQAPACTQLLQSNVLGQENAQLSNPEKIRYTSLPRTLDEALNASPTVGLELTAGEGLTKRLQNHSGLLKLTNFMDMICTQITVGSKVRTTDPTIREAIQQVLKHERSFIDIEKHGDGLVVTILTAAIAQEKITKTSVEEGDELKSEPEDITLNVSIQDQHQYPAQFVKGNWESLLKGEPTEALITAENVKAEIRKRTAPENLKEQFDGILMTLMAGQQNLLSTRDASAAKQALNLQTGAEGAKILHLQTDGPMKLSFNQNILSFSRPSVHSEIAVPFDVEEQ